MSKTTRNELLGLLAIHGVLFVVVAILGVNYPTYAVERSSIL